MSANTLDTGLYIHWPFCKSKCPYCDFNVHVHDTIDQELWKDSYLKALNYYAGEFPDRRIISIFFGGGTPSLMPVETVGAILDKVKELWPAGENIEITLEANPTSVEIEKFRGFRSAGVNRVSLGVQSLDDEQLKFLGRQHSAAEALKAIETAGQVFDRYSFDLIYARPDQSLKDWEHELRHALAYANGHMSLYQLTVERSTPFYMDQAQGKFKMPEQEMAADFYHLTQDVMEETGLPAYEISNHAAGGHESVHNRIYWEYGDYIGIGPGAHGRMSIVSDVTGQDDIGADFVDASNRYKVATRDHAAPEPWLKRVAIKGHGAHPHSVLTGRDKFIEALMMGLRLREGISLRHLRDKSGLETDEILDRKKLKQIIKEGWMHEEKDRLRLTREGWLRLNALVPFILKDVA